LTSKINDVQRKVIKENKRLKTTKIIRSDNAKRN